MAATPRLIAVITPRLVIPVGWSGPPRSHVSQQQHKKKQAERQSSKHFHDEKNSVSVELRWRCVSIPSYSNDRAKYPHAKEDYRQVHRSSIIWAYHFVSNHAQPPWMSARTMGRFSIPEQALSHLNNARSVQARIRMCRIDVEKSPSHHVSQGEIGSDNPLFATSIWKYPSFRLPR
jgi:hypothetical protein